MLNAFLAHPEVAAHACAAQGQCIEHFGAGEPYLPLLDALGRMCHGPLATPLVLGLERYAPGWLVQMPGLLEGARLASLRNRAAGTPTARMLRELSVALDIVAREVPVVIVLEDLHWSDHATLDWLAFFARRQEPSRMLVLCSYRPVEVIVSNHPLRVLKHELRAHGLCEEIHLGLLNENAVTAWLMTRFRNADDAGFAGNAELHPSLRNFASALHQRTDGNPLFVSALIEELVAHGLIVELDGHWQLETDPGRAVATIPEGPKQLIAGQLAKMSGTAREVLEAVSVVIECSTHPSRQRSASPWPSSKMPARGLARNGQFLRATALDEHDESTRFRFIHALYREVVYDGIPAARRAALHAAIGAASSTAQANARMTWPLHSPCISSAVTMWHGSALLPVGRRRRGRAFGLSRCPSAVRTWSRPACADTILAGARARRARVPAGARPDPDCDGRRCLPGGCRVLHPGTGIVPSGRWP